MRNGGFDDCIARIFWAVSGMASVTLIVYMICIKSPNDFRETPVSFYAFDTTEISARLQYIGSKDNADYFRTITDSPGRYYYVRLIELVPELSLGLRYSATLGDSIVKHKYSNTLVLFNKKAIGYYNIEKPLKYIR